MWHRLRLRRLGRSVEPKQLVLFVGNPRSGTTLVRSLLNAHPAVTLGNELDLLGLLADGERSWPYLMGAMIDNAARFDADPRWTGYDYRVAPVDAPQPLQVIGDKKSGRTTKLLSERFDLLEALLDWSPIPVRFVQCVRHPLDVVTTKTRKNPFDQRQNVDRYFGHESVARRVAERVGPDAHHRLHLEDLVDEPRPVLRDLCGFLGLEAPTAYLDACAERVLDRPRRTREAMDWPPPMRAMVRMRIGEFDYLRRYLPSCR